MRRWRGRAGNGRTRDAWFVALVGEVVVFVEASEVVRYGE